MTIAADWARAFARQARADWGSYEALQKVAAIPDCHKLLFLQMACEKITKAHLFRKGANPADLQSSHAYAGKHHPRILEQQAFDSGMEAGRVKALTTPFKHLSESIELLAPAVKRGGQRPDNCEYPWEDALGIHVPLDWTFEAAQLLLKPPA